MNQEIVLSIHILKNKIILNNKTKKQNIPCLLVLSILSSAKRKPVKRPSRWNVFGAAIGRWYSLTSSSIVALLPPVRFALYRSNKNKMFKKRKKNVLTVKLFVAGLIRPS